MTLQLYNTLTRRRETFTPADPSRVTMYVCGPTVYNYAHIGNARPFVVFDVLARLLRQRYGLVYARNITDVDDRINEAARQQGISIGELTERYTKIFHEDMAALGVRPPDVEPRVTEHIPQIVSLIERLVELGHAYVAEGHVLFSVDSFERYGELSGRALDEMIAGARVDVAPYKHNAADFVLWKPSEPGETGWDSPFGYGRPGWHIECSAMVETHLGESVDIHGGGLDLVFPHHENEVAQSTCAHAGKPFCRYWVHNGLVHVESEKMSKSLGNVLLIRSLLEAHPAESIRLGLLTAHYRQPLDWTEQLLTEAGRKLDRLYGALRDAGVQGALEGEPEGPLPETVVAALEDDLNTPKALAALFDLVRAANRSAETGERRAVALQLRAGAGVLGLLEQDPEEWFERRGGAQPLPLGEAEIDALVARRDALRRERDFAEADRIRDELAALGIVIEDRAEGTRWHRERT